MMAGRFIRTLLTPSGTVGFAILLLVASMALAGPMLASNDPTAPVDLPSLPPTADYLLGTDFLGRDVLARLLNGGASVILMSLTATLAAYLIAVSMGMYAGLAGGLSDAIIMRGLEVILAFPPLMILLLLVGGLQSQIWVLIVGVVIVQLPSIARITRAVSLTVAKTNFVEAAHARGDSSMTIIRRDVLPNILPTVVADFGIRFGVSIILVASMNYLGLGLQPPASDWGLMISENQAYVSLNPWAVIAPGTMLALITIGVNLFADKYISISGSSGPRRAVVASASQAQPGA